MQCSSRVAKSQKINLKAKLYILQCDRMFIKNTYKFYFYNNECKESKDNICAIVFIR